MKATILAMMLMATILLTGGCNTHRKNSEQANGRWEMARNKIYFQLARQNYDDGKLGPCAEQLQKIMTSQTPYPPAFMLAAKVAMKQERYGEAETYLRSLMDIAPNSAEGWYGEALMKEHRGDLDSALESITKATALDPNDPEYLLCLAELQVRNGESDKALKTLTAVESRFATNPGFQSALADLHMMAGNYGSAIVCLRRVLKQDQNDSDARERLALAMARDGQADQAVGLLEILIEKRGDKSPALNDALGLCYMKLEKYEKAERVYTGLCQIEPGNTNWNYRLAECYANRGDDGAALERLTRIIEIDPQHSEAQALAGYLYLARGNLDQAEQHLRVAIEKSREPLLVAVALEKTLRCQGRDEEAQEVWAEFGNTIELSRRLGSMGPMAAQAKSWTMGSKPIEEAAR